MRALGDTRGLPSVEASLAYLGEGGAARFAIYPPSSGKEPERPPQRRHAARIHDCRPVAARLDLDRDGFLLAAHSTSFGDFLDDEAVRTRYYPEVESFVRDLTGAALVAVFDHNVRSASGAARGQAGVRAPVDTVHGDYTEASGRRRIAELLRGLPGHRERRAALINVWRPIRGPVLDLPLAVCLPASVAAADLVPTAIDHFGEDDLAEPAHVGEIYSVRHRPEHRWFYAPAMTPAEVLVFKGYDSRADVSRFTPHTGFAHPERPAEFVPRESIEVRVLVVYAERSS